MKAVIQRVSQASVTVNSKIVGEISKGTVVLLGVENGDGEEDALWLAKKIAEVRMFGDSEGKMNLALQDVGGSVLAVSQFTLAGNCEKGRRPSFTSAAPSDEGNRLYQFFVQALREKGLRVETGIFQTDMKVSLINDGPVTFILESRRKGRET
ncbi:MAG: D-aminoacyl-tRNA deacylase [Desulfuromonadales bacterium]|nr:D-aminoacyl-tRNA deacylase [Desulfuromonadales bacterium]